MLLPTAEEHDTLWRRGNRAKGRKGETETGKVPPVHDRYRSEEKLDITVVS